jgi:predicted enzyme related to lactoylglutathione lyase
VKHLVERKLTMNHGPQTIIYPVRDLVSAKPLYGALLDTTPYMEETYYGGLRVGDQELGSDPHCHDTGLTAPAGYRHMDDIEAPLTRLIDSGAEVQQAITEVSGGRRIASVKDADGNVTGLLQG